MQIEMKRIHILDKKDFKTKNANRNKEQTLLNDKGVIPKEDITCNYLYTQHRSPLIYKANINGHKGRN